MPASAPHARLRLAPVCSVKLSAYPKRFPCKILILALNHVDDEGYGLLEDCGEGCDVEVTQRAERKIGIRRV